MVNEISSRETFYFDVGVGAKIIETIQILSDLVKAGQSVLLELEKNLGFDCKFKSKTIFNASYRVLLFANKQKNPNHFEMSILRRLICQGRALLRYHLFGQGKYPRIKIEQNIHLEVSKPPPPRSDTFGNQKKGFLDWIGSEIHSQVRKVFVDNVLRRVSGSSESLRKSAINQLINCNNSRPFFALVGVSLASGGVMNNSNENEFEGICSEIRRALLSKSKTKSSLSDNLSGEELLPSSLSHDTINVNSFNFGPLINNGCNAAVYAANFKTDVAEKNASGSIKQPDIENEKTETPTKKEDTDNRLKAYPLAIKMMYNYDVISNASAIFRAMHKEIVPAKIVQLSALEELDKRVFGNLKQILPHPNIVDIQMVFADQIPLLEKSVEKYPQALPQRLYSDGLGRNMSLFLVMKRYDCNLHEFLTKRTNLKLKTRVLILLQILEGVSFLELNRVAHRDLKSDNILLNINPDEEDYPSLVLADFGCCLADESNKLKINFTSNEMERGGNVSLMPPEILTATPGLFSYLNYEKYDAFSVGAIAYEIFGCPNPFYKYNDPNIETFDSRTYKEAKLTKLPNEIPKILQRVVSGLLKRNPNERISGQMGAYILHIFLWAPSLWTKPEHGKPTDSELLQWLVTLTTKVLCYQNAPRVNAELEFHLIRNFLRNLKFEIVKEAISWMHNGN